MIISMLYFSYEVKVGDEKKSGEPKKFFPANLCPHFHFASYVPILYTKANHFTEFRENLSTSFESLCCLTERKPEVVKSNVRL